MPSGDDPAYRRTVFGSGRGLLTFHVDDNAELTAWTICSSSTASLQG